MRKSLLFILIFALMCNSAYAFSGGSGTSADPYQISTINDLQEINKNGTTRAANYLQINNIDASITSTWNSGAGFKPIGWQGTSDTEFEGTYDGNGYKISNIYINRPTETHVGIFGYVSNTNSIIKNVEIENANVTGKISVGTLVGTFTEGDMYNITTSGFVNSVNNADAGGIAGTFMSSAYIKSSSSFVDVTSTGNYGGIVGYLFSGSIVNSYSTKERITGKTFGTITNSYYDSDVSGFTDTTKGTPKTTNELKKINTYSGWDFDTVWGYDYASYSNYPMLQVFIENEFNTLNGSGTSESPYEINNVKDLQLITHYSDNADYIQINDIDASDTINWNNGKGFLPIGDLYPGFNGHFNGNGYTISNLYINRTSELYVGLFGRTETGSSVTQIILLNPDISGDSRVGAIGINYGDVSKIAVNGGSITGNGYCGGIIGTNSGTLSDSYSTASVTSSLEAGGALSQNTQTATNIYSTGTVTAPSTGGLCEYNTGTITNSYWDINTSGLSTSEGGTGKTTQEMTHKITYSGWDFTDTWQMDIYPVLYFEELDYSVDPLITSPTNGTTFTTTYPPLSNDYVFQWSEHDGVSSSVYQLAKDENYNTIVASGTITTFSRTIAIESGDYWFRVKYNFDDGTESDFSESVFTVNTTLLDYGTAVQGVVYKTESGSQSPLPSANVVLYNDTYSETYTTSSNGYYLFDNLANSTYYIQASKDGYEDSTLNIVTLTSGTTATKNIVLEPETAPNYIMPHYVQLYVKSLWNTYYPGVTITVYEGDSATALGTKVTDSTGGVGFELKETVTYRITAYSEELGIDEETTLTPTKDTHNIYVSRSLWDYIDPTPISMKEVEVSVDGQEINATHAYINVSYSDAMSETTDLNIYVKQSNKSDPLNQTTITSQNLGAVSETNHSFIISDYSGKGYFVNVIAEHDTFGTIDRTYSVQFQGMNENFGWSKIWIWLAVGGMIFVAGMFGKESVNQGAITVCVLAWIMYGMGWFSQYNSTSLFMGLSLATVISVASYMNQKSKEEGS